MYRVSRPRIARNKEAEKAGGRKKGRKTLDPKKAKKSQVVGENLVL